jgi:hypothetical protein
MNAEFKADPCHSAHRLLVAASIMVTAFTAIGILLDASQDIGGLTVSRAILAAAAILMACSFRLSGNGRDKLRDAARTHFLVPR